MGGPGRARSGAGEGSDCGEEANTISFNQPAVIKEKLQVTVDKQVNKQEVLLINKQTVNIQDIHIPVNSLHQH